jgi:hypothetical protein
MDAAVIPNNLRGNTMADLAEVLKELKQERSRMDQAIEVIGKLVGRNSSGGQAKTKRPKRTLSTAARRKIAAAQRARWARVRQKQERKAA